MAILSKACKPDNLELHNSLKFSFMNIWGLHSNFDILAFLQECQNVCPDILALCETNLDDSTDSGNFSVRGYLPLIRKDFSTLVVFLRFYQKISGLVYTFVLRSWTHCKIISVEYSELSYLLCLSMWENLLNILIVQYHKDSFICFLV